MAPRAVTDEFGSPQPMESDFGQPEPVSTEEFGSPSRIPEIKALEHGWKDVVKEIVAEIVPKGKQIFGIAPPPADLGLGYRRAYNIGELMKALDWSLIAVDPLKAERKLILKTLPEQLDLFPKLFKTISKEALETAPKQLTDNLIAKPASTALPEEFFGRQLELFPQKIPEKIKEFKSVTPRWRLLRKMYDWADIQAPFTRAGAYETGVAVKNMPSMHNYEQIRAIETANQLRKLNVGLDYGETVLREAAVENPPTREAKVLRKHFDDAFKDLREDGVLKKPWPHSQISRNEIRIAQLETDLTGLSGVAKKKAQDEIDALGEINTLLKETKYIHIPLNIWRRKIAEALGDDTADNLFNGFTAKYYKGRFFRQRKTVDIGDYIDWLKTLKKVDGTPIFEPLDFHPVTAMANYGRMIGEMRGLARIFKNARREGLLIGKHQTRPDGYGDVSLDLLIRFPELKNYHMHNAFSEYLTDYLKRSGPSAELGRVFGYTKIMAFYNPVFLGTYDVWQGAWLGAMRSIRAPSYLYKGFRSAFTKDMAFKNATEYGAFSTPFSPPFENFVRDLQKTIPHRDLERTLMGLKGRVKNPLKLLDDAYRPIWNLAWSLDHAVRMSSYHYAIDKLKMTPKDAAQLVAHFHGDYARLTPHSRRILNKIFFTPTFKYAMGHVQANMAKSAINVLKKAARLQKPSDRDLLYAKGLAALITGELAKDAFLSMWGFEPDDLGLRYKKTIETEKGKKDLIIYWPTPGNVLLRQFHKWTKWGFEPDKWEKLGNKIHWDLHPLWQTTYELIRNVKPNNEPIYNLNDDGSIKAWKIMHHATSRIVAAEGFIEKYIAGEEDGISAYKKLEEEMGVVGHLMESATLAYLRKPENVRRAVEARRLKRLFNYWMEVRSPPKDKEEALMRTRNFMKKLRKILEFEETKEEKEE